MLHGRLEPAWRAAAGRSSRPLPGSSFSPALQAGNDPVQKVVENLVRNGAVREDPDEAKRSGLSPRLRKRQPGTFGLSFGPLRNHPVGQWVHPPLRRTLRRSVTTGGSSCVLGRTRCGHVSSRSSPGSRRPRMHSHRQHCCGRLERERRGRRVVCRRARDPERPHPPAAADARHRAEPEPARGEPARDRVLAMAADTGARLGARTGSRRCVAHSTFGRRRHM